MDVQHTGPIQGKIVETLFTSHTELIANPAAAADPEKRHAMEQLLTLLQGALEARGKVLVKLNVSAVQLQGGHRLAALAPLAHRVRSSTAAVGYTVETVVPKSKINVVDPGAEGPRGDGHHRAVAVQDRALTLRPVRRG